MASAANIRNRLPSLYRPEAGDPTLLNQILRAAGEQLDELNAEANTVLQAHWFRFADRALYDPFLLRQRELDALPLLDLANKDDQKVINAFPYLHDLARLAALLGVSPWREPPNQRESVETFRQRVERVVKLYRNGLSTVAALRGMVEVQLPVDLSAPLVAQDRSFAIEEYAMGGSTVLPIEMPGEPLTLVGPLMRWNLVNEGLAPTAPTLYIQGVTPEAAPNGIPIDATVNPVVELYQSQGQRLRIGIAYDGEVAPGETLRLQPAFTSWLGMDNGPQQAISTPTTDSPADPTAAGPWQSGADAPTSSVTAMLQSVDKFLWVATVTNGVGDLWRYDGQGWKQWLIDLPLIHTVATDGLTLLLGTAEGLRLWRWSETEETPVEVVADLGAAAIYALYQAQDGQWWVGSESGLWRQIVDEDGSHFVPFVLHADASNATPVYAIHQDTLGIFYFGTEQGLFQYQPALEDWYWYGGDSRTEQTPEWQPFRPTASGDERNFPTPEQVFLPSVRAIYRGQDAALWLGSAQGLARYVAHSVRGLSYTTQLEAFPDLLSEAVFAIQPDARGHLWFATARGLLRYDGRDLHQWQSSGWRTLGRADTFYGTKAEERGAWRFDANQTRWQRFDPQAGVWTTFTGDPRTTTEAAVRCVFWVDQVVGDLGSWDGITFTSRETDATVDPAALSIRFKPTETTIITGGIPAIPRLPVGVSTWRYLRREEPETGRPEQRPAWTEEGRLLPLPTDRLAPPPGRYNQNLPPPPSEYDEAVFAFPPAAQIWFDWATSQPFRLLVRLHQLNESETLDPAILDRVWQGMQQVRPAGVGIALAVGEAIVRE